MQFLGHPCDRPKDIRARPFILTWATENRKVPLKYKDASRPIFRVEYQCLGKCDAEAPEIEKSSSEDQTTNSNNSLDNNTQANLSDSDSDKEDKETAKGVDQQIQEKSIYKIVKNVNNTGNCPRKVKIHVCKFFLCFFIFQILLFYLD